MLLRPVRPDDADAICAIYNHYVAHTVISFEEQAVSSEAMRDRIASVSANLPWFVCECDEPERRIAGYAYATPWRARSAYRYSVESTVYVAPDQARRGVGTALYSALIEALRARGLHSVIGGIALPNPASVGLHEALGFEKVAEFREVGLKFERWVNVGYWQLLL
jgi:L-amino acid N-acyltransferase YncA